MEAIKDIFDQLEEEEIDAFDSVESEDDAISNIKAQLNDALKKFDATRRTLENNKFKEELKSFIEKEVAKIKPIQNVIEKTIEKKQVVQNVHVPIAMPAPKPEIIKEIKVIEKEVLRDDGKKYVEEKTIEELKSEIDEMKKRISSSELQKIWPNMRMGKIIPSLSNQEGKVLSNTGNKLVWVTAGTGGGGTSSDVYSTSNVTTTRNLDPTTSSIDDLYNVLASLIQSLQGAGIIQ